MKNRTLVLCASVTFLVATAITSIITEAHASEVERNWALHGAATQSSTALGGDARLAIDGNTNGDWNAGSVTHTNQEVDPYWEIDLGASYYIDEIRIFNRTDCCQERLHDYVVFFANSKEGFQHRDLNSTLGENTTNNSATAVFSKLVFGQSGDIDPVTHARSAMQTIKITGDDCSTYNTGKAGCLVRHVRIQIAGQAILSLAEVEIIEKGSIPGPAPVADAVTWKPTGVVAESDGTALVASAQNLLLFYRGTDKQLHASVDFSDGPAIAGSPSLEADAPAAAWTQVSGNNRVYVATRRGNNDVAVVESDEASGILTSPVWNSLGKTRTAPALVVACNRVFSAWLDGTQIKTSWKFLIAQSGTGWSQPTVVASNVRTSPSLAANADQTVGMSFLNADGSIGFVQAFCETKMQWSPDVIKLAGLSLGDRANLAAYGRHFIIATIGEDNRGYLAVQHVADNGQEAWQGFEPIPASSRGDPGLHLAEAPRLVVMSGAIIAIARDRATQQTLYWIKFPNHLRPGDTWMGGRPVGRAGTAGVPASMTSFGQSTLQGYWQAPAEIYIATRGGSDHHIYAMNLGRFIANDVFQLDLHLTVEGMINIEPQPPRSLDPTIAPNLFEQMLAVLALPNGSRAAVIGRKCGSSPLVVATFLELDRDFGSGQERTNCPFEVIEGTNVYAADSLIHEWLHVDSTAEDFLSMTGFADTFKFSLTSTDPADSGMKACTSSKDCGGDSCELAGDTHGASPPFDFSSTKGADSAETSIRRWDNTRVCVSRGGPDGRRYQGGLRWYDVGTFDHALIHMVIAYRWYGDDLRDWVRADSSHGNNQLQLRYDWVKTHYFDGVEYNGRLDSGAHLPQSDRSLGFYGMPSE